MGEGSGGFCDCLGGGGEGEIFCEVLNACFCILGAGLGGTISARRLALI